MSKIHDRMRKILALAERGERGERDNAQSMLQKMMEKYNVTLEELKGESVKTYWWNYDSKHEKVLLCQIVGKIQGNQHISYYKGDRKLGFNLTSVQHVEVDIHYVTLRRDLKEHLEASFRAFIQVNQVFADTKAEREEPYSAKELEKIQRMMKLAQGINPSQIHQQLS